MNTRFPLTQQAARCVAWLSASVAVGVLLASCGSTSTTGTSAPGSTVASGMQGTAMGGRQPIVGATILVYSASLSNGVAPQEIGNATTGSNGTWNVATLSSAPAAGQLVYVVALGGNAGAGANNPNAALMTAMVAGSGGSLPASVNLTELTTVATTAQLQSYITEVDCTTISGTSVSTTGQSCPSIAGASGLSTAASNIANLADITVGEASTALTSATSGSALNITLQKLNFQASVLAACINSVGGVAGDSSVCGNLFALVPTAGTGGSGKLTAITGSPFTAGGAPNAVTVTANGQFVYVPNSTDGTVSAYTLNSSTGALTPVTGSPFAAGNGAAFVEVSPSGDFAYVANFTDNTVCAYAINSSTGALTPITGTLGTSTYATGAYPYDVAVTPNGAFAIIVNDNAATISVFSINSSSGALTPVTGSPFKDGTAETTDPISVAVSPDGAFAYVANYGDSDIAVYSINSSTGALTPITGSPFAGAVNGGAQWVSLSPNGKFAYVANFSSNNVSVYSINSSTGALTQITGSPFAAGNAPSGMALSPNGAFAYVANYGDNTVSAYTVNTTTGVMSQASGSPFTVGSEAENVAVSANGNFVYVANFGDATVSAFTIKTSNGTTDTIKAALTIASEATDGSLVSGLFALDPLPVVYSPIPTSVPTDWTVAGG